MSAESLHNWLEVVTAVSTAGAALFAAFSTWTSKQSVNAARDAIEEARLSRRAELAPKLILEKSFFDLQSFWPHADSLNGEAVFLARHHWKDKAPKPPTFSLQNFGQSPVLELAIVWQLDDSNGELIIPADYQQLGLNLGTSLSLGEQGPIETLMYSTPIGVTGLPLYRRWTTDVPSCSPGQSRVIDFPQHILNTLFARGLQFGSSMPKDEITLTATINCYSLDGVEYKAEFRWRVIPFSHGGKQPVVVYGHFFEMPLLPRPKGPRVA